MSPTAVHLTVSDPDAVTLGRWARSTSVPAGLALGARIVLLAAEGHTNTQIARLVGCSRQAVVRWGGRSGRHAGLRRSVVMSGSSVRDCEVVKGRGRSRAWWRRAAARLTGVRPAEHADGELRRQAMACGPMPLWTWEPVPTVDIAPWRDGSH